MTAVIVKVALDPLTVKLLAAVGAHWDEDPLAPTSSETPLPHIVRKAIRLYLDQSRRQIPTLAQRMDEIERAERAGPSDLAEPERRVVELVRRPRGRPRKPPIVESRGRL